MTARWLEHFRLTAAPFSKEIEDEDLWVPSSRAAVVDDLVEACKERGHALRALTQGNRGCRLLRSLEPHRGAGRGEGPPGLPARRGSPPPSGLARSPAHPGQLRVGQEAAAQPDPGRLARDARPHATAQEPLTLVAGAYP